MDKKKFVSYILLPIFWLANKFRGIFNISYSEYIKRNIKYTGQNVIIMPGSTIIGGGNLKIDDNSYVAKGCVLSTWASYKGHLFNPKLTIGKNVSLGEYNHVTAINEVSIGDGVLTGRWVTITDNSHGNLIDDITERPSERTLFSKGVVKIEANVWIGDKATILPNVCIGEGAIIGANSVVTKDVPPYCVMAGNPAKVIRQLHGNN